VDESAGNAAEPALDAAVTGAAAHAEENAPEVTGSKLILVNPRSRARLRAALAFGVGLAAGLFGGRATVRDGDTTDGIALALGAAVDGTVDREAFVWEASQGFLHDAVRGRGVTFRAELTTGEAKQHDVFHARVRLGREGRALSVVEVRNLTETPDADEGELVGHAGVVGFLSWHEGRVTGLTAIALARWCDGASALDRILAATAERLSTHNGSPWPTWRVTLPALASEAELQGFDGALEARTDAGTLRLELETGALAMSPTLVGRAEAGPIPVVVPSLGGALASVGAAAWRRLGMSKEHPSTHAPEAAAAREPPSSSAAPGEAARVWPPALEGVGDWRAVVDGASDGAPAALLTAALQFANGTSVELAAIDTRALVVEPHAGWNSPRATTGPGGLGQVRSRSGGEVVARLEARPFGSGGFVEDGRTLIPPIAAPALVVDLKSEDASGSSVEPRHDTSCSRTVRDSSPRSSTRSVDAQAATRRCSWRHHASPCSPASARRRRLGRSRTNSSSSRGASMRRPRSGSTSRSRFAASTARPPQCIASASSAATASSS